MRHNNLTAHLPIIFHNMRMLLAVLVAVLFVSCGRARSKGAGSSRSAPMAAPRMMNAKMSNMALDMEDGIAFEEAAQASPISPSDMEDGGGALRGESASGARKLIRSASIALTVSDLDAAESAADNTVKTLGGYVAMSNRDDSALSIDIKVPAARFDEAVASVEGMGALLNKSVDVTDVTDRYYDLDSRIRTKQILKERLESYLASSANMKDLVAVETQLNTVISDLESMQGQFKRLSGQIDYSNIHIRFCLPSGKTERGWKWPSVSNKLRAFIVGAASFFSTLVLAALGIVLFGTPLVFLAAFLYCITFGKVGWVKKLFKSMKE